MDSVNVYQTNLTDEQWLILEPLIPEPKSGPGKSGRPTIDVRQAINGILYLNKSGCQWRMIPKEFGKWNTIYYYFKNWREAGVWYNIMDILNQKERVKKKACFSISRMCR